MNDRSRRSFLTRSAAALAGAGIPGGTGRAAASTVQSDGSDAETKPFMDQYYEGILAIVRNTRDTQIARIAEAMEKAYALKRDGGTVYSNMVFGHFAGYAGCRDLPGQPWVLPQYYSLLGGPADAMKKGDFLLTNIVNFDMKGTLYKESDHLKRAHDRGVFIAGVTSNYYKWAKTPPGVYYPERMAISLEEIANLIIDSGTPWNNGLVATPRHPRFNICPSTGIAQFAVYWACTASFANLIGSKGKGPADAPARAYLDLALERFGMIGSDRPKIDRVAEHWADLVLEKGARLFVYGEPFKADEGVVGNMFVSDAVGAANGSMIARGYNESAVREHDIVLICSIRSNNARDMEIARAARAKGAYVTAFCPFSTDGDASGPRLFREVDAAFNTYAPEHAGVVKVEGFPDPVSPLTGLTGNLVLWMLTAQWADHMARRGAMPYFWQGIHETGGMEYDQMVKPYFEKRGY